MKKQALELICRSNLANVLANEEAEKIL